MIANMNNISIPPKCTPAVPGAPTCDIPDASSDLVAQQLSNPDLKLQRLAIGVATLPGRSDSGQGLHTGIKVCSNTMAAQAAHHAETNTPPDYPVTSLQQQCADEIFSFNSMSGMHPLNGLSAALLWLCDLVCRTSPAETLAPVSS
jgi:hypothetical protein